MKRNESKKRGKMKRNASRVTSVTAGRDTGSRSIRQKYTHRGERRLFKPFLLETSQVRRATAGSRVNLHEHACDAKWVMCHAAVMVVLDRESAQDGVVAQPLREKSLQVNNGPRYKQRE